MGKFAPYEGMQFNQPNAPYNYTVLEIDGDTLKCHWIDTMTDEGGYCKMSVGYAEKLNNLCLDSLTICRKE